MRLRIALNTGVPFGIIMGAEFSVSAGWRIGVPMGLVSGVLFGLGLAVFMAYVTPKRGELSVPDGERLLKDGPANRFVGVEGVGGWLYLTNAAIRFRPHSFNIQKQEFALPLEAIASAVTSRTLGLIPNGLVLSTTASVNERFVVEGSKDWVRAIVSAQARTA